MFQKFQKFLNSLKTPQNASLIEAIHEGYQACFEDIHDYYDVQQDMVFQVASEIIHAKEGETQPWSPIKLNRISKIWNDYMTLGIIRDEKGLNNIVENVINKIAHIHANTELAGHTQTNPKEYYENYLDKELTDKEADALDRKMDDYLRNDAFSDYGLEPLVELAIKLTDTTDPKEQILLIDQVLNVVHQRSDLASLFVEGGRMALDELSGYNTEEV